MRMRSESVEVITSTDSDEMAGIALQVFAIC